MKTTIKTLCGLLAILAFTACSSNTDETVNTPQFWHVTLTASMGDADTRALSEGANNTINASFAENDEVVVVDADGSTIVGTLKAQSAGASTTLSGTLDASTLTDGEVVTVRYRSATANYDGQVGTLDGIATNQDYAEGTLTVKTASALEFTSTHVSLAAKQSITKFSFKNASTNAEISVKTFGIAAVGLVQSIAKNGDQTVGAVTGTLATPSSDVYVALRNNSDEKQTYSFYVKDDAGNWYTGTKKANLANGKNYTASVTLTKLEGLTNTYDVGTVGVVGGLPAIVVEINSVKKAVALMNVGALCPEAYGTYYTFTALPSLSNGWYVPTQDELFVGANNEATGGLAKISNSWGTQNGVYGRTFTITEGKTLFLPAAGYYENGNSLLAVSTDGYYWSSTPVENSDLAIYLDVDNIGAVTSSQAKVDGLTVRPFHALQ
jgi:hypothetical protein